MAMVRVSKKVPFAVRRVTGVGTAGMNVMAGLLNGPFASPTGLPLKAERVRGQETLAQRGLLAVEA